MNIANSQRYTVIETVITDNDQQMFLPVQFKSMGAAQEVAALLNRLNDQGLITVLSPNPKFEALKRQVKALNKTIETWVDMQPELRKG